MPTHKQTWLTTNQRYSLVESAIKSAGIENVQIVTFTGLLVVLAKTLGASVLIRGLRAVSDFEYEQSMGHANRALDSNIETFFILCQPEYSFISSSLIREVVKNNGDAKKWLVDQTVKDLTALGKI